VATALLMTTSLAYCLRIKHGTYFGQKTSRGFWQKVVLIDYPHNSASALERKSSLYLQISGLFRLSRSKKLQMKLQQGKGQKSK
jgi:hypothetical protein